MDVLIMRQQELAQQEAGFNGPRRECARGPTGQPVEGLDGNWKCGGCANVNFGTRDKCHRCHQPKMNGGAPTGQQFMDPSTGQVYTTGADGQVQLAAPQVQPLQQQMQQQMQQGMLGMQGQDAGAAAVQQSVIEMQTSLFAMQQRQSQLEMQVTSMQTNLSQLQSMVAQQAQLLTQAALGGITGEANSLNAKRKAEGTPQQDDAKRTAA